MKRKLTCDLSSAIQDDLFIPRPAKRMSMCDNTPKQARDEKKKLLKTCRKKLKQLEHPEANLHRSLLVNNVYRQLQSELKQNKPAKSYGYAFNPRCPFGYRAGAKEVANRRKLAKLQEVLDKKQSVKPVIKARRHTISTATDTTHSEVTWLRNPHVKKCITEKSGLVVAKNTQVVVIDCDKENDTTQATVAMDYQTSVSCDLSDDCSDTEEIDVCTVEEGDSCPLLLQSVNTNTNTGLLCHNTQLSSHQTVPPSTHTGTQGTSFNTRGTLVSEGAALGDFPWVVASYPYHHHSDRTLSEPSSKHTYQSSPCDHRRYVPNTDSHSQYMIPTPYQTDLSQMYTQSISPFCLSTNTLFYPSVTPHDYLSSAYCTTASLSSGLYPGVAGFPSQTAATPGHSAVLHHPTASMVTCT